MVGARHLNGKYKNMYEYYKSAMTSSKYVPPKRVNITAFDLDVFTEMSKIQLIIYYCIGCMLYRCGINSRRYLRLNNRIRSNLFSIYE